MVTNMDLDKEKIGIVLRDDPSRHLHRLIKMVITVGEKRSWIEILGAEATQGRPRIRKQLVNNTDLSRQAREYARKWQIVRQNIEVTNENHKS